MRALGRNFFDEGADQRVHYSVLGVSLVPVAEHLVADDGGPVRFISVCLCLEKAITLQSHLGVGLDVTKARERLLLLLSLLLLLLS